MAKGKTLGHETLDERPGHLIRRLQQISFALFMHEAQRFDITPVQYAAIFAIGSNPGIDQTTLCNIIAFDRSTIGDVVGRLEKKKLIKRQHGPADRRTKSLFITANGRRLLEDIEPAVEATQRLILAPLAPGQRIAFMRMLKQLVQSNNERSRAPLRPIDAQQNSFRPGRLDGRPARAAMRSRPSAHVIAD